jgi:hypothetical protein
VTLCLRGASPWGIIVMRLSFFSGSDERPMLPHLSVRDSSPDFRVRDDNLMRGCFFCGRWNSTVGAVVMISGARLSVRTCQGKEGNRGIERQAKQQNRRTYVAVRAGVSRRRHVAWPLSRAGSPRRCGSGASRSGDVWASPLGREATRA